MVSLSRAHSPGEFASPLENPPQSTVLGQDCCRSFLRGAGRSLVVLELRGANPFPGTGPTAATPGEIAALGIGRVKKSFGVLKSNGIDRY